MNDSTVMAKVSRSIVRLLLEHGPEGGGGGARHEDVEPAEGLADPVHKGRRRRGLGQLQRQRQPLHTQALDRLQDLMRRVGLAPIGDHAVGAVPRELKRDGRCRASRP